MVGLMIMVMVVMFVYGVGYLGVCCGELVYSVRD